jgi:hypothetical protein
LSLQNVFVVSSLFLNKSTWLVISTKSLVHFLVPDGRDSKIGPTYVGSSRVVGISRIWTVFRQQYSYYVQMCFYTHLKQTLAVFTVPVFSVLFCKGNAFTFFRRTQWENNSLHLTFVRRSCVSKKSVVKRTSRPGLPDGS